MEDLISIGQFATASRLSPKALRLYDENGLLPRNVRAVTCGRAVGRRRILRYLRKRLKETPMFEVQTKRINELRFASRTERVRVAELDPFIES